MRKVSVVSAFSVWKALDIKSDTPATNTQDSWHTPFDRSHAEKPSIVTPNDAPTGQDDKHINLPKSFDFPLSLEQQERIKFTIRILGQDRGVRLRFRGCHTLLDFAAKLPVSQSRIEWIEVDHDGFDEIIMVWREEQDAYLELLLELKTVLEKKIDLAEDDVCVSARVNLAAR